MWKLTRTELFKVELNDSIVYSVQQKIIYYHLQENNVKEFDVFFIDN